MLRSIIEDADRDRSIRPGAVLLIGDSIIGQLDARLIARNAFNFGVGGSTTRTLLARLRVLRSTDSAAAIVLGVGDLRFRQVSEILPDYADVVNALPASPPLIVVSVLPVDEQIDNIRQRRYLRNDAIRALNVGIKRLCDQRPGCRFLDVTPVMANPGNGGLRAPLHGGDGWHLSPQGSAVLGDFIATALRQDTTGRAPAP